MNRCLSFWRKQRPGFSQTDPHAWYWEQPQSKYKRFVLCFSNLFCQTWREENWWPDLILLSTISNSMEMAFWLYYHRPKRVGKVFFLRFTSNDGFLWFSCVIQNLWCITIAALISAASCGADWNISPYAIFLSASWISHLNFLRRLRDSLHSKSRRFPTFWTSLASWAFVVQKLRKCWTRATSFIIHNHKLKYHSFPCTNWREGNFLSLQTTVQA